MYDYYIFNLPSYYIFGYVFYFYACHDEIYQEISRNTNLSVINFVLMLSLALIHFCRC